jgi:hypothetical protein
VALSAEGAHGQIGSAGHFWVDAEMLKC